MHSAEVVDVAHGALVVAAEGDEDVAPWLDAEPLAATAPAADVAPPARTDVESPFYDDAPLALRPPSGLVLPALPPDIAAPAMPRPDASRVPFVSPLLGEAPGMPAPVTLEPPLPPDPALEPAP